MRLLIFLLLSALIIISIKLKNPIISLVIILIMIILAIATKY